MSVLQIRRATCQIGDVVREVLTLKRSPLDMKPVVDQPDLHFVMRLGSPPQQRCMTSATCPDIFLLSNGNYAVIGHDMTHELISKLPAGAAVAPYERIVVIPRAILVSARKDIPIQ